MQPRDPVRADLYERARKLRWTLAAAAGTGFAVLAGLVVTNPIGTQAQAASAPPADPAAQPQQQAAPDYQQPAYQQPRSVFPPVSNAGQPILRTRRS